MNDENILRRGGVKAFRNTDYKPLPSEKYFLLNRLTEKSHRFIGNFTRNLAEAWMGVRCKNLTVGKCMINVSEGHFMVVVVVMWL